MHNQHSVGASGLISTLYISNLHFYQLQQL